MFPAIVRAQFSYVTNDDSITITGYSGPGGAVVIPHAIHGYPVTAIGQKAFGFCNTLTGITIPDSVTNIGDNAFWNSSSLTNVVMSEGVTSIGNFVFSSCFNLTTINIPTNAASIGEYAFAGCTSLGSITIPNSVTSIGEEAFYNTALANVTIPGSVTNIDTYAFAFCPGLSSAYFQGNAPPDLGNAFYNDAPATVYYLPGTTGWGATFGDAPAQQQTPPDQLTWVTNSDAISITITGYTGASDAVVVPGIIDGYAVTGIGPQAFLDDDVTNVILASGITSIGDSTFAGCVFLNGITLPNSVISIGNEAFLSCGSLANVVIPNGVTSIGYATFDDCNGLTNVIIPGSVTYIGQQAFYDCFSLTSVTIPNGVTNIEQYAFANCIGLTSLTIPNSVVSIGASAFDSCASLTSVTIPGSVTNIGYYAFADSSNLVSAYFLGNAPANNGDVFKNDPATVYYLPGTTGWGTAFGGVSAMAETPPFEFTYVTNSDAASVTITAYTGSDAVVAIPAAINGYPVTVIGDQAFYDSSITNALIPGSVISIGNFAFNDCFSLTSVTMGTNVTSIGFESFFQCVKLTDMALPDSLSTIGYQAFKACSQLTNVIIPNSVTNIGSLAFSGCFGLTNETIPYSVTTIGSGPFADCANLTNISVDPANPDYSSTNGVLFDKSQTTIIQYPNGLANDSYTIPDGVTNIGDFAFYGSGLTAVVIPNSVVGIGVDAFSASLSLTGVTLPNGLTSIGEDAFFNCNSLTNIIIPASVTTIGDDAFAYSPDLTSASFEGNAPPDDGTVFYNDPATIYYLAGTTGWSTNFGGAPTVELTPPSDFTYVTNSDAVSITITGYTGTFDDVAIPGNINGYSVTSIGMNAFTDDTNLTSITIPNSVTSIGDEAFGGCWNLTNAVLPDSIISIGEESFGACFSLTNITIPNSVTSIGVGAFDSCTGLSTITIPNSVTNIGQIAFENCSSMTNILVDAGNLDYSSLAGVLFDAAQDTLLAYPAGMTNNAYAIPDSVATIQVDAFVFCANLNTIAIPASVTNIVGVFFDCAALTNICVNATNPAYSSLNGVLFDESQDTLLQYPQALPNATYSIPNTVTNIQGYAFSFCTNLVDITIPNGVTSIGIGTFQQCSSLASIVIPNGVANIPEDAFQSCTSLTNIIIPDSVTNIGWQAFSECSNLANVIIPASVTTIGDFAFANSPGLASAYFEGNAPPGNPSIFANDPVTVYYSPGTTGWGATFGGAPTVEETLPSLFTYVTNSDAVSITITGYTGTDGDAVIPGTINGYTVTSVGMNAFAYNTNLTSVTVPNSVTNIGDEAFASCTNLASVVLPDSVISIGEESFLGCASLTNINIPNSVITLGEEAFNTCTSLGSITVPNSVTNIGEDAFVNCVSMTNIFVDPGNPNYSSQNGVLFDKVQDTLITCPSGLTNTAYTIPDGVATIANGAFFHCPNLDSVAIPDSVTNIIGPPFFDCTGLTNISVNATNPDYCALNGVLFDKAQDTLLQYPLGLTNASYTIPDSVTTIQGEAFSYCANLVNITIPNGVTNLGYAVFQGCSSLESVIIPNGVTSIPELAFAQCASLTNIIIPASVTNIGSFAFNACTSLASITIPASVNDIQYAAFDSCANLTSAYFEGNSPLGNPYIFDNDPVTVYYLAGTTGWGATFGGAPTVEESTPDYELTWVTNTDAVSITITGYTGTNGDVVIPGTINGYTVTSVGMNAFAYNTNLTSVTVPNSVTNIGDEAFASCTNLASVVLPDSVISIGEESFLGCTSLTNINIPNSVITLGEEAFNTCTSLGSITVPNSVTNIGEAAFVNCVSMTNIFVDPGNPNYSSLNGVLFDKVQDTLIACPSGLTNTVYTIPDGVATIANGAFFYCPNLDSVAIPDSVTNIIGPPFFDCTGLTNISVNVTNPDYSALNGVLFDKAQDTLLQYPLGLTNASYTIPDSVTTIQGEAFSYCANLVNITIPNGVTNLGYAVFQGCSSLETVTIPNGVTGIPELAFAQCTSLTNIIIPASVTTIGELAFGYSSNLASAYFEGNAPADYGYAFFDDPTTVYYLPGTTGWGTNFGGAPTVEESTPDYELTWVTNSDAVSITITGYTGTNGDVVVPGNINSYTVTSVGTDAFTENTNLTSVIVPNSVTNIGGDAFLECADLASVSLPDSIVSIGEESFLGCTSLTNINIPNSVITLGDQAFDSCTSLGSITIPNSVTNIGEFTFGYCLSMTNIIVDSGNPNYSSQNGVLFDKTQDTLIACPSGLTNTAYTIPDGVATIDEAAFFHCTNLASFTLPASLTNIIGPPFYDCTGLTNISVNTTNPVYCALNDVLFDKAQDTLLQYPLGLTNASYTIPDSVTTIQGEAFSYCANLINITIPNGVTNLGYAVFQGCSSLESVIIPNGVTGIPELAFSQCSNLDSVIIPDSVTNIGLLAFNDCTSLASITIPASVNDIQYAAFDGCASLTSAYFEGNAPPGNPSIFDNDPVAVYYLPGTTGWGTTYGGVQAVLWNPQATAFNSAGGEFGFNITGPTNAIVVVEACTNLVNPVWLPLSTNTLSSSGISSFTDPQSSSYPNRYYRFSAP